MNFELKTRLFNFSDALMYLKNGFLVERVEWTGRMFLFLVPESEFAINRKPLMGIYTEGTRIKYRGHIDIKTVSGDIAVWSCPQIDLLAEDWKLCDFQPLVNSVLDSDGSPKLRHR